MPGRPMSSMTRSGGELRTNKIASSALTAVWTWYPACSRWKASLRRIRASSSTSKIVRDTLIVYTSLLKISVILHFPNCAQTAVLGGDYIVVNAAPWTALGATLDITFSQNWISTPDITLDTADR